MEKEIQANGEQLRGNANSSSMPEARQGQKPATQSQWYDAQCEEDGEPSPIDVINSVANGLVELKKSGLTDDVTNMYRECVRFSGQTKAIEAMSKVKLEEMAYKFEICQKFITSSFNERNGALQKDYKVLDDAVKRGDRELIIAAMGNISSIVTTSPLSDLQELCKRFDDPTSALLDF